MQSDINELADLLVEIHEGKYGWHKQTVRGNAEFVAEILLAKGYRRPQAQEECNTCHHPKYVGQRCSCGAQESPKTVWPEKKDSTFRSIATDYEKGRDDGWNAAVEVFMSIINGRAKTELVPLDEEKVIKFLELTQFSLPPYRTKLHCVALGREICSKFGHPPRKLPSKDDIENILAYKFVGCPPYLMEAELSAIAQSIVDLLGEE